MCSENQTSILEDTTSLSSNVEIKTKQSKNTDLYSKKWTVPENILYARYLKTHMSQMNNRKKKKCGKFVKMANFIGSKTENQCRSHHQKMMLTFKSIQNIIKYAAEIKQRGQLVPLEQFQQNSDKDEKSSLENQNLDKIEEQLTTQRQQGLQLNQEKKDQFKIQNSFSQHFPIVEEESQFMGCEMDSNSIFDVLNIDAPNNYSQYFSC